MRLIINNIHSFQQGPITGLNRIEHEFIHW